MLCQKCGTFWLAHKVSYFFINVIFKVHPSDDYIKKVFKELDLDGDGNITQEEWHTYLYYYQNGIFGWFEYLN